LQVGGNREKLDQDTAEDDEYRDPALMLL